MKWSDTNAHAGSDQLSARQLDAPPPRNLGTPSESRPGPGGDFEGSDWVPYGLRSLALLVKVLDQVDGDDLHGLHSRIAIQKKIYLAQEIFGVGLGYSFEWNMYGPFSKGLANECDSLEAYLDMARSVSSTLRLREAAVRNLERVRDLTPPASLSHLSTGAWMEVVASVHMLATLTFRRIPISELSNEHRTQIENAFLARKPQFTSLKGRFHDVWRAIIEEKATSL